jgi:hypothetical protein
MSLTFFLGALLLTDRYLHQPSGAKLWGIGACAMLSILSHNYPLLGLMALPLYLLIMGGKDSWRSFLQVTGVIGAVYLIFAVGYFSFAGLHAAASRNHGIFVHLPGPAYLLHLICGAFLSPFFYLFWGYYHFPIAAYVAGGALLAASLIIIWRWGGAAEKHLALWALLVNVLPFFLVSLTRYQRSVSQAFVSRYDIFTLIGALLLVGTAWRLLAASLLHKRWVSPLGGVILAVMVGGQIFSLPLWTAKYLEMSQLSRKCFILLNQSPHAAQALTAKEYQKFCPDAHPTITPEQARAVRGLLGGVPEPL